MNISTSESTLQKDGGETRNIKSLDPWKQRYEMVAFNNTTRKKRKRAVLKYGGGQRKSCGAAAQIGMQGDRQQAELNAQ